MSLTSVLLSCHQSAGAKSIKHHWKHNDTTPAAVAEATAAIAQDPNDAEAYLRRAQARGSDRAVVDLSLKDVERAIALGGDQARYYNTKAYFLDLAEEDKEALKAADMACKLDPESGQFWHMRAVVCYHLKMNDECLKSAEKSIRLRPDNPGYRLFIGRALRAQGRYQEALAELSVALKSEPKHVPMLKDRMEIYCKLKNWKMAIADGDTILTHEIDPGSKRSVLESKAAAYRELKQYAHAVEDYKQALKLFPDDRRCHAGLLETYMRMGDKQNADRERKVLAVMDEDYMPPK